MTELEKVLELAEVRYQTDATFHYIVDMAVNASVPKVVSPEVDNWLRSVVTTAACVVLILNEANND